MSPSEKREILCQQVATKISWGATEREILEWLEEKQGIRGEDASEVIRVAVKFTVKDIRHTSMVELVCYGAVVVAFIGFLYLRWSGGFVFEGLRAGVVYVVGTGAVLAFLRSLRNLFIREKDFRRPDGESKADETESA